MDAAFEFSINGLNMEFAINLVRDGCSIPDGLIVDILTEKVNFYINISSLPKIV